MDHSTINIIGPLTLHVFNQRLSNTTSNEYVKNIPEHESKIASRNGRVHGVQNTSTRLTAEAFYCAHT